MYDFDWPENRPNDAFTDNSAPINFTKRGCFVLGAVAMLFALAAGYIGINYAAWTDHKRTDKPLHVVADCSGLIK